MSRLLDWLFNRTEDGAAEVMRDAEAGLLDGDGPEDVAEVVEVEHADR